MPGMVVINPVKTRITDVDNQEVRIKSEGNYYSLATQDEEQLDLLRSIDHSLKQVCILLEAMGK